jgi:hypothetical protein
MEDSGQEVAVAFSDYGLCGEDSVLSRSRLAFPLDQESRDRSLRIT